MYTVFRKIGTHLFESLEMRRVRADLVFAYKIIFGMLDVDRSEFFSFRRIDRQARGHAFKLYLPVCRTNIRYHFYNYRVVHY